MLIHILEFLLKFKIYFLESIFKKGKPNNRLLNLYIY